MRLERSSHRRTCGPRLALALLLVIAPLLGHALPQPTHGGASERESAATPCHGAHTEQAATTVLPPADRCPHCCGDGAPAQCQCCGVAAPAGLAYLDPMVRPLGSGTPSKPSTAHDRLPDLADEPLYRPPIAHG